MKRPLIYLFSFFALLPGSTFAAATLSSVEIRQVRDTSAIILLRVKDGQNNETLSTDYTFTTLDVPLATSITVKGVWTMGGA